MPLILNAFGGWLNYPEYFFFWAYHGQNAVFNTMAYQNPEMDKLIDARALRERSGEVRRPASRRFVKIAFNDVPRIPLFQPYLDVAMQTSIVGYTYWFHRQLDFRQLTRGSGRRGADAA